MERRKSILLAAGVLAAGVCAATPFWRPRDNAPVAKETTAEEDGPVLFAPSAAAIDSADGLALPAGASPKIKATAQLPEASVSSVSPPSEDQRSPGSETPTPMETAKPVSSEVPIAPVANPSSNSLRPQSWRRHRIKDGDTLPKLAQRYLGDPVRAPELFDLNRDVLPDPAILPIGVWLRIPAE